MFRAASVSVLLLLWATTNSSTAADAQVLRGTVRQADGSPAADAVVWAAKFVYGPLVRQETVSAADGSYSLELQTGEWFLWARRGTQGGEGPGRHEPVSISAEQAPEPINIRLEERGTFSGRMLEAESGKPIVGGKLFLDAGVVLTTNADGRFEIGGLDRTHHESFVVAPGRVRMRVLFDTTASADTKLNIAVPRTGKIAGTVTDVNGKPIPGAYVGRSTSGSFFSINGLYVACEPNGYYEYDDAVPPDQPTRLSAGAPGYIEDQREGLLVPPDGTPLELRFYLRPKPADQPSANDAEKRRIVSGTVRGPDGAPVTGVVVRWGTQQNNEAIETRSDQGGRYRLTVPEGANRLSVLPRNLAPDFPEVAATGDQTVEVRLESGTFGIGRVVDDDGQPLKDVQVIAMIRSPDPRIGNPMWLRESSARTDADGRFLIAGVPEGATFDFLKSGLSDRRGQRLNLGGGENNVTMKYGGALVGRVVDQAGNPLHDFRVLVGFPHDRRPGDKTDGYFAGYSGIGVRFTSSEGTFVLTGVGAESVYRLTALADGHGEATADRVIAVPVNRLRDTEPATLRAGRSIALRVRAMTEDGKTVAAARVTLVNGEPGLDNSFSWGYHDASWENMVRGRTAADGWADFPSLGFSGATLLVQAPGYARSRIGWRGGQNELTVKLLPEAVITGEVRSPSGEPLKSFYVNASSGGDHINVAVEPEGKGRFRLAELPAGNWSLTFRADDGVSQISQQQVSLSPGETKELSIEAKAK